MKSGMPLLTIISAIYPFIATAQYNTTPWPNGECSFCNGTYTQPNVACVGYTDRSVFCCTGYGICCNTKYAIAGTVEDPECGNWARSSPQLIPDGEFVPASFSGSPVQSSCTPRMLPAAVLKELSGNGDPLHVVSNQPIDMPGVVVGRVACDAIGDFYAYISDNEIPASYRMAKISPSGATLYQRDIEAKIPGIKITAFSVLPDGTAYVAGNTSSRSGKLYVITIGKAGKLSPPIELQTKLFAATQLVAFPSGELLVARTLDTKPVTRLFDSHGNLLKDIYEPEDEALFRRAETGELSASGRWGNKAVWNGDAVLGSDGNAYMLRAVNPALIYVIAHDGTVVRKFTVQSPLPGLTPHTLRAAQGRLAISFVQEGMTLGLIRLTSNSGEDIETSSSEDPGAYPGLPGCYNGSSFSFLSRPDDSAIVITVAK